MERLVSACWLLLAAVHVSPAAVLLAPNLTERLYGVSPSGSVGLLIIHRGALFLAVVLACAYAAMVPEGRRTATIVAGVSMLAFLVLYASSGFPAGPLRTVALVDALGLLPLAIVIWNAWVRPS